MREHDAVLMNRSEIAGMEKTIRAQLDELATIRARLAEAKAENERLRQERSGCAIVPLYDNANTGERFNVTHFLRLARAAWRAEDHRARAALAQPKESKDD